MKKIVAIIISLILVVSVAFVSGCAKKEEKPAVEQKAPTAPAPAAPAGEAAKPAGEAAPAPAPAPEKK